MDKRKILQLGNLLAYLAVVTINALANALPINGYTTGELSAQYPNLFVPAGITFSIWGLIYLALGVFVSVQARDLFRTKEGSRSVELIGLWFIIASMANMAWILAWHYQFVDLSAGIMVFLLLSLIQIYRNLGIGLRKVSVLEKYAVHAPFSIYLGWISVATIANFTALLVHWNWSGWGLPHRFWTAAMILVATLIGLYLLYRSNDIMYTGVLVWALAGIIYKRYAIDPEPYPVILTTAIACIFLLVSRYFRNRKHHAHPAYF